MSTSLGAGISENPNPFIAGKEAADAVREQAQEKISAAGSAEDSNQAMAVVAMEKAE